MSKTFLGWGRWLIIWVIGVVWALSGCSPAPSPPAEVMVDPTTTGADITPVATTATATQVPTHVPTIPVSPTTGDNHVPEDKDAAKPGNTPPPVQVQLAYTHQQADGNRLVSGQGTMPEIEPLDIQLAGQPQWLVAAPVGDGSLWVTVLVDGRVQAFLVQDGTAEPVELAVGELPPGMPALLRVQGASPELVVNPTSAGSSLTHPVVLSPAGDVLAFIEGGGDLVLWDGGEQARIALDALPDARLLIDEVGRLLLLTGRTERYAHGVLGDDIEAAGITLVEPGTVPPVSRKIDVEFPLVVEGIVPLWVDLTGDGQREIVVTLSDAAQGARIAVYNETGDLIALGPAVGQGFRWRHQLMVAPFGPNGEMELAVVLTPHIGGKVEFYRLADQQLAVVAELAGFSTHTIGSRNLDTALAGDLDGDSRVELLVPDQTHTRLGAIQRSTDGAELEWSLPVGGRVSTNLAAVEFPDGGLGVGVGHDGNAVRLWLP